MDADFEKIFLDEGLRFERDILLVTLSRDNMCNTASPLPLNTRAMKRLWQPRGLISRHMMHTLVFEANFIKSSRPLVKIFVCICLSYPPSRNPPRASPIHSYEMLLVASKTRRFSLLKCPVLDLGNLLTSTRTRTLLLASRSMNSFLEREPCPTVYTVESCLRLNPTARKQRQRGYT